MLQYLSGLLPDAYFVGYIFAFQNTRAAFLVLSHL
jgi:hypothetical protein